MINASGYLFCETCASPVRVVPFHVIRRACLGVVAWRMLDEHRAPLHRRASMAPYWIRAMQSRYPLCTDQLRGCFAAGNTLAVIAAYERIRKEAGDFDQDELEGLN